jgi:hypothetical protein
VLVRNAGLNAPTPAFMMYSSITIRGITQAMAIAITMPFKSPFLKILHLICVFIIPKPISFS